MTRETVSEELEHLERIAIRLGELKMQAVKLPLNRQSVLKWVGELRTFVMSSDQLELQFIFSSNDVVSLEVDSPDVCRANIDHYLVVIDKMREYLYSLKVSNRNGRQLLEEVSVGDYCRYSNGRILFRGKEVSFTGKLRDLLVAFLDSDDHTLSADGVMDVWGDQNRAAIPRHINKLNEKLKPLYGDGKTHIRNTGGRPAVYKLDIE